ncbi:MAG TPA: type I secretion C-terminal target domain-containing protein, partial [Ramlibacter sp.]|nr:type I secretion C-terminal target domain-containing protein [Ramlibacter sp.]
GSTLAASSFDAAWADRATSGAFVVTLDPAASTDSYDFQLLKPIDGGVGTFNTETGTWAFAGGNTNYVYYEDLSGQNLPSVLLTPSEGTRLNGTANQVGMSGGGGGQNIGSGESVRVDFVSNISGTPKAADYVVPADHAFDEHVMVNGAAVTFSLNTALARATVNFRAYDDADTVDGVPGNEQDDVGDYQEAAGTSEQVTRVTVNGTVYTSDFNAGGIGFSVDFLGDGSVDIGGLKDGDTVAIFTGDGFTTVEYHYVSGSTFALSGFGATTFDPGALAALSFDLGVYDSDGDVTIVNDGLQVLLSPDDQQVLMGTSGVDNLSAPGGQSMTLVGLGGNDVLTGNTGNDILVGGQGDDVISGGAGSDTAAYLDATSGVSANLASGTATGGDGTDSLNSIENVVGSRYGDTLIGDAQDNTLLGGAGDDTLRGGAGNDTLYGSAENVLSDTESDTFVWSLGDAGSTATPASDVIRDLRVGAGGDVLDLRDLLDGEVAGTDEAAAQSLAQYLNFTEVDGNAVMQVDPNAGTFAPTQNVTFENMSMSQLTAGLGLADNAGNLDIIREMLEQGNLKNSA